MTRKILFSPEDAVNAPRIAQISQARKGEAVHGCAYTFSLSGLALLIQAQAKAGILHFWLFDHSQYISTYNPAMKTLVDQLKATPGVSVWIGNAPDGRDISHDKFAVVGNRLVQYGSANYSVSSEHQTNHTVLDDDPKVAAAFLAHWNAIRAGMLSHPVPQLLGPDKLMAP